MGFGIYADDGAGYPGALIDNAGPVATTSLGAITIAKSMALAPALYWLAACFSGATTAPNITADNGLPAALLGSSSAGEQSPKSGYVLTGQPAGLPSSFPAGASVGVAPILTLQA